MNKINLSLVRKNPLTIPVLIADKMDLFKKYNIDVNIDITEDFLFDGNKAFYEGEVDAMVGDLTFFFYMLQRGKKAVVTSTLTRTIHLVGGKSLPKDLKNLKVGVNQAGLFPLFLENDLKDLLPDTEIIYINNSYDRMKALEEGKIHALVAIEPFISDILEKGGEIIWNSRNSDKNLVMWAFDETFYRNNKETVRKFHKALEEAATKFNEGYPENKIKMAMESAGYTLKAATTLKDFEFEKQRNYSVDDFELCQQWMYREKKIDKLYDAEKLIGDVIPTHCQHQN